MKKILSKKAVLLVLGLLVFLHDGEAQNMKYLSSKIISITAMKEKESLYVPVLRIEILTSGNSNPLLLSKILFDKKIKNKKFLGNARMYFTGSDSNFSSLHPIPISQTSKAFSLNQQQTLQGGVNNFWIACQQDCLKDPSSLMKFISFELGVQEYSRVWADEFNSDTINRNNWKFERGFVRNNELQWYQEENASCSNGLLVIEARRENKSNPNYEEGSKNWRKQRQYIEYTSGSLSSADNHSWQYGRFEMRARIDTAPGYWPAWWTLGIDKPWPSNGEIDIMEYYKGKLLANYAVGTEKPYTALWFSNTFPVHYFDSKWKDSFHIWKMDWDEEGVSIYLDDVLLNYQPQKNLYNRDNSKFFPFKQKHFMLLNLAIGGVNGGDPSNTVFPLKYEVDYVSVSQKLPGHYKVMGKYQPEIIK